MRKTANFPNKFHISPQKMQFQVGEKDQEQLIGKQKSSGISAGA